MKKLKFIHITKTGGTTIENISNKTWGRFQNFGVFYHCTFDKYPKDIQEKYDWFMVVRNPYVRILSEFKCGSAGIGNIKYDNFRTECKDFEKYIKHNKDTISKDMFNSYIQLRILNRGKWYYHYTELYKYLPSDPNIVMNIIRFENLNEDFDKLMGKYSLDFKLNKHSNKSKPVKFTINDFSDDTINMINEVYHKDFELFNYEKIIPST